MIGGDGINDESNKTAPPPAVHVYLTINSGTLPLPDPIDGPGLDRSDDPGLDM